MIYDRIDNLYRYIEPSDYRLMQNFLKLVSPNMEEKLYIIDGERIYAKVMSYETKNDENCKIEAHNKYIDIQGTILGAEGIDVYNRMDMVLATPYDEENDVVFFDKPNVNIVAHTNNFEGYFTMLGTNEAHAPQERVNNISNVKKFVIKYKCM